MNHFPWQSPCAAAERRELRASSEAVDDDGEDPDETNAAVRLVFTRIRAGATESIFIISEIVRCRGTGASRAGTERISGNAFRLPIIRTPPDENDQPRPLSDRDSSIVAFRSAKKLAIRATFTERTATSTHHRTRSPPPHGDRLGVRTTTEPADGLQHQDANQVLPAFFTSTNTSTTHLVAVSIAWNPLTIHSSSWASWVFDRNQTACSSCGLDTMTLALGDSCLRIRFAWMEVMSTFTGTSLTHRPSSSTRRGLRRIR